MADIELVIKIPVKAYNALMHTEFDANLVVNEMRKAISNGTPLPKEHGRLIDADVVVDGFEDNYELCIAVNSTPTIIEAEREEEE